MALEAMRANGDGPCKVWASEDFPDLGPVLEFHEGPDACDQPSPLGDIIALFGGWAIEECVQVWWRTP